MNKNHLDLKVRDILTISFLDSKARHRKLTHSYRKEMTKVFQNTDDEKWDKIFKLFSGYNKIITRSDMRI